MRDFHKLRAEGQRSRIQVLDQVASECNDKVVKINDQARVIINKRKGASPTRRLKEGEPLPVPPPELLQLEDLRKQTLFEAREQLRSLLGQKAFDRIDTSIQNDIEARTKGSSRPSSRRPTSPYWRPLSITSRENDHEKIDYHRYLPLSFCSSWYHRKHTPKAYSGSQVSATIPRHERFSVRPRPGWISSLPGITTRKYWVNSTGSSTTRFRWILVMVLVCHCHNTAC